MGCLALLHSHDALVLLRNSLAMPKLLYTLQTFPCSDNCSPSWIQFRARTYNNSQHSPRRRQMDSSIPSYSKLRTWSQEYTNAGTIHLFGFDCITLSLQNAILPPSLADCLDIDISAALSSWRSLFNSEQPPRQSCAIQKAWDGIIASVVQASLLSRAESPLDQARLLSEHWRLASCPAHHSRGTETRWQDDPSICWYTAWG